MILIDKRSYELLLPSLLKVEINHLFARAVLDQKMDGEVYVDDPTCPSTFFVKHAYGMSLLWGDTENESFNSALKSYLLNESGQRGGVEWMQVFPNDWNKKLIELLGAKLILEPDANQVLLDSDEKTVAKYTRVNFRFVQEKYAPFRLKPGSEFQLKKLENGLFEKMKGSVIPTRFWRNQIEFCERGAGFSVVLNGEPVSTAFSAFVHDQMLELGIETLPELHRRGLAPIACSALIDYCLENKLEPVWACRLENIGSFKLAEKLGFEVERMIPYYQLSN